MALKVLVVLSSHDKLGDTGKKTGWYLVRHSSVHSCMLVKFSADHDSPNLLIHTTSSSRPGST